MTDEQKNSLIENVFENLPKTNTTHVALCKEMTDYLDDCLFEQFNLDRKTKMENEIKHPVQPLVKDPHGVLRFKENKIVSYLLENGGIDMNKLATINFSQNDREQFAQLIGYSLGGFGDLSYVSDETYSKCAEQKED